MFCIFKGIKFREFSFVKYKKFHGSYLQNIVLVNFSHLRYLQNKVLAKSKLIDCEFRILKILSADMGVKIGRFRLFLN